MTTKSKKRIVILGLLVLLIVAFFFRFQFLNQKYPNPKVENYAIGEIVSYHDCELKVTSIDWGERAEIFKKNGIEGLDSRLNIDDKNNTESQILLVSLELRNSDTKEHQFQWLYLKSVLHHYSASISPELVYEFNENFESTVQPGETVSLTLPYEFLKTGFQPDFWNSIDSQPINFVISQYPTIKQIAVKS